MHTAVASRFVPLPRLSLAVINSLVVSTLYWSQPAAALAGAELGPSPFVAFMPGAALAGYAIGVMWQASRVRDLTSRAGLGLHLFLLGAGLAAGAASVWPAMVAGACLVIGIGCSLTQRLLALSVGAATPAERAGAIGRLIALGLLGLVLARGLVPVLMAAYGWRAVFAADAVLCAAVGTLLLTKVGRAAATSADPAGATPSALALWRGSSTLRGAAWRQAAVFALFNGAWAIYPRFAASHQLPVAGPACVVALLGAGAALAAGAACRRAGPQRVAASGMVALCLAAAAAMATALWLPALHVGMALLDMGTQLALVANHARVQAHEAPVEHRGRMAAMLTTVGFLGGALGAAVANLVW